MRVEIIRPNLPDYRLIPHPNDTGTAEDVTLNSIEIAGDRSIEEGRGFRKPWVNHFDRKNGKTTITIRATRLHASHLDAQMFLLDHHREVPNTGVVVLTAVDANGVERRRWFDDAAVQQIGAGLLRGKTTTHTYVIVAGQPLTTNPAVT